MGGLRKILIFIIFFVILTIFTGAVSAVEFTTDEVANASGNITSYVQTNHALPSSVNISGSQVNMAQYLHLSTQAVLKINNGSSSSIILQNPANPTNPSENIEPGNIPLAQYITMAGTVNGYMQSNQKAPNYSSNSGLGTQFSYQNLIYTYSKILNSYKNNNVLPASITVIPWNLTTNYTGAFTVNQTFDAATWLKEYVENNHQLPEEVTITGTNLAGMIGTLQISLPSFLELLTTITQKINNNITTITDLSNAYKDPTAPSETITAGNIPLSAYINMAGTVNGYMQSNQKAPNYSSNSGLGTQFGYQNLIYTYSRILNSYKVNRLLPASIEVDLWKGVYNNRTNTSYVHIQDAINDAFTVNGNTIFIDMGIYKENILVNKTLDIVAQNGKNVIIQASNSSKPVFKIISTGSGSTIQGFIIKGATDSCGIYIDENTLNCKIRGNNITDNKYGVNVRYAANNTIEFNDILDNSYKGITVNYGDNNIIRDNLIKNNADHGIYLGTCQNIIITGNYISGPGLYGINPQASTATINYNIIDEFSKFGIVVQYSSCVVNATNNYYGTNSPKYVKSSTWPSTADVYVEAGSATYNPWCSKGTEFSRTNIIQAAISLKSYIETNRKLPISISISGTQVSMPQFLQLLTQTVLEIKNNTQSTNITLEFLIYRPILTQEEISKGTILQSEYISIANDTISFMDEYGYAPNYMACTSLGSYMSFESLIYMYSQILSQYNTTTTLPANVTVTPWLAVTNPNMTYNIRTNEVFSSIQAAIDDADTKNGDTVTLGKTIYFENVVLNKTVAIISLFENTTITALNQYLPVFTILFNGSGSFIENLIINGSTGNAGILINNSSNNTITGNNITGNSNGISLYNSTGNQISENIISNNNMNGITVNDGIENDFLVNTITNNGNIGITINTSNDNLIYSNNIANNTLDGIYLYNSPTKVNFNRIALNSRYGLSNLGNGTLDAQNNWWGSNNPLNSTNICIGGGSVNCTQWLVLNVTTSIDRTNRTNNCYNNIITADLTQNNNGDDTSRNGDTLPDGIPITTTMGTTNTSANTKKGRSTAIISNSKSGMVVISTVFDKETINNTVNFINITALAIHNNRTGEGFTSIQTAINDSDTINGDVITLEGGTYTENVIVHKPITITPVTGGNVTVRTSDESKTVFTIIGSGSGSKIQGLKIRDATDSYGVALSSAHDCNITGNAIEGNNRGIYFYLSNNNTVYGNTIYDNYYGICLYNSTSNNMSENNITGGYYGVYLLNSNNTVITGNSVTNNWDGIHLYTSIGNILSNNTINGNWMGIYLYQSNSTNLTGNVVIGNGGGISHYDSNSTILSGNNVTNNWIADISKVDSSKMVIATTIYTCGPAALATVMKNLGVNTTEAELAQLAGTDLTGTTMWGLVQAAKSKGLNATGFHLSTDQLQPNYIVVLKINGVDHYNIIRIMTNTTVYLIDPNLGEIEMSLEKFNELYTGYALVVANETIQINATVMTEDEMKNIKGMSYVTIYLPYIALKWYSYSFYIPYIYAVWHPIKWYGYTVGWWPSFHIGWKKVTIRYCIPVLRYKAIKIYVLSRSSSQGGGTPIASVGLGSTMAIINTIGDIKHTGLHEEFNYGKLYRLGLGASGMLSGFWNTQIAAGSTSNTNSIDAVREREKFVNSMDIFAESWNDPWTIWVPPNYDGTTITRPA